MAIKAYKVPGRVRSGAKRMKRGAENAYHNKKNPSGVGKPKTNPGPDNSMGPDWRSSSDGVWNPVGPDVAHQLAGQRKGIQQTAGYVAGATAVATGGGAYAAHKRKPLKAKLAASRVRPSTGVSKADVYRITNLGTRVGRAAERADNKAWGRYNYKPFAAGAGVGVGATAISVKRNDSKKRYQMQQGIKRNEKRNQKLQQKLVTKNMNDPFGIEKRDPSKGPGLMGTVGAMAGGSMVGGHAGGAIAGGGFKQAHATRKAGTAAAHQAGFEYGRANPGAMQENPFKFARTSAKAGKTAAHEVEGFSRVARGGNIGAAVGSLAAGGAYIAHKKKQQKLYGGGNFAKSSLSAFGVDHG